MAIKYPFRGLTDTNLLFHVALTPYPGTHLIPVVAHVASGIAVYTVEVLRDLINERTSIVSVRASSTKPDLLALRSRAIDASRNDER